jgi:hypothetical protein
MYDFEAAREDSPLKFFPTNFQVMAEPGDQVLETKIMSPL